MHKICSSLCSSLATLAAALMVAGCGGGQGPSARSPSAQAPSAQAPSAQAGAAAAPAATAQAGGPRRRAQALDAGFTLADDLVNEALQLLPYIEQSYAVQLPGRQPSQHSGAYTYRCYPATGNCVGHDGSALYALGPAVGSLVAPVRLASLADYCSQQPAACGAKIQRTVVQGSVTRHYIVYVPWRALNRTGLPVVFMLHGTSGTGEEFYANSGWREKADAEGLIAVFPTALRHCYFEDDNANGSFEPNEVNAPTKWADGMLGRADKRPLCTDAQRTALLSADAAAAADHPLADDMAFFQAIVSDLNGHFPIDPKRLYVTGFSNGSQMAQRLAGEAAGTYAAVACHAGTMTSGYAYPSSRPMSMILSIGDQDDRYTEHLNGFIPVTTDVGATPAYLTMVQPFLNAQQLAATPYTWRQATLFGDLMSIYHHTTSTATPAASNELYVAVIQGRGHMYPRYMPDLLWGFFRDKRLP